MWYPNRAQWISIWAAFAAVIVFWLLPVDWGLVFKNPDRVAEQRRLELVEAANDRGLLGLVRGNDGGRFLDRVLSDRVDAAVRAARREAFTRIAVSLAVLVGLLVWVLSKAETIGVTKFLIRQLWPTAWFLGGIWLSWVAGPKFVQGELREGLEAAGAGLLLILSGCWQMPAETWRDPNGREFPRWRLVLSCLAVSVLLVAFIVGCSAVHSALVTTLGNKRLAFLVTYAAAAIVVGIIVLGIRAFHFRNERLKIDRLARNTKSL